MQQANYLHRAWPVPVNKEERRVRDGEFSRATASAPSSGHRVQGNIAGRYENSVGHVISGTRIVCGDVKPRFKQLSAGVPCPAKLPGGAFSQYSFSVCRDPPLLPRG